MTKLLSRRQVVSLLRLRHMTGKRADRIWRELDMECEQCKCTAEKFERYIESKTITPAGWDAPIEPAVLSIPTSPIRRPQHPWSTAIAEAARGAITKLPRCCEAEGFVYFVEAAGLIKIGRGWDAPSRLAGLQCQIPIPIKLVLVSRGYDLETILHNQLIECRQHGEWFDAPAVRGSLLYEFRRMRRDHVCLRCAVEREQYDQAQRRRVRP